MYQRQDVGKMSFDVRDTLHTLHMYVVHVYNIVEYTVLYNVYYTAITQQMNNVALSRLWRWQMSQ